MVWLQYELALPLAMIALILFVMPLYGHLKLVSVYEFLEQRFDLKTRLVLSGLFLFVRAFATAVTVYSIAIVIELITGLSFFWSVVLLGAFTVVYDIVGGIRGVIYSDVLQMVILVSILVLVLVLLVDRVDGLMNMFSLLDSARHQTLDFSHHGLGDGQTFAFWPMLLGGFFLYLAYYGCDQSQVQRELSAKNIDVTNQSLFLNGLLRFPLVLLYCFVGVGIGAYASVNGDFIALLPSNEGSPEYNLAVPLFMIAELPAGLVGLGLVALFAAAMSSLDSVINSLSATTMEDFVRRFEKKPMSQDKELWISRGITALWGCVTLAMAFAVGDIAPTVLEAINKVGSLANGPILAVFALALFTRGISGSAVILGLLAGMMVNGMCWLYLPELSWLWWNPCGFLVAIVLSVVCQRLMGLGVRLNAPETLKLLSKHAQIDWQARAWVLLCVFIIMLMLLAFIQWV